MYRGLSLKYGKQATPILGLKGKKPFFSTPKIDLTKAYLKEGFKVEKAGETAIIRKGLPDIYKPIEIEKFTRAHKIMRATETTPSKYVQKKWIAEAKALKPKGVREVLKFAKQEKAELYGSFTARQQMPLDLTRKPGDIDVLLKVGGEEAALKTQVLTRRLQKIGEEVRVSSKHPTLIEAKGIDKKWHHAVDIHSLDQAMSELKSPSTMETQVYGLRLGQKNIKIEGIKAMPLSEQGIRKGAHSMLTMREKGFAPASHRMKDIPDFFSTQETLIRSKLFGQKKLMKELGKLKALYPEELFKKTVKPEKILIYSPTKSVSVQRVYPSLSRAPSQPISEGISPSVSGSRGLSSYKISPSLSKSVYSTYKYYRVSPSKSPSKSPSISPGYSPSISPSVSPSKSPSISPSYSPSYSQSQPPRVPLPKPPLLRWRPKIKTSEKKKKQKRKLTSKRAYTPTVHAMVGFEAFGITKPKGIQQTTKKLSGLEQRWVKQNV